MVLVLNFNSRFYLGKGIGIAKLSKRGESISMKEMLAEFISATN
jgi:hypothetical protein